jgi:tetratricopeptide (TPR) repeat protein
MLKFIKTFTVVVILLIGLAVFLLIQQNNKVQLPTVLPETLNSESVADTEILKDETPEFIELITQAENFYQQGAVDTALQKYVEAYRLNRSSVLPFLGIAKIYLDNEKIDLAEDNLTIAQQKGRLPVSGKILLARLELLKQNYNQAEEILASIRNKNNEIIYLETIVSLLLNNYDQARENVKQLTTGESSDKFQTAGQSLQNAFDIYDTFVDSPTSYLLTLSAENLIQINEFALARPLLLQAINEKNDYRDAWVLLGYSYLQSNLLEDADQALRKAKQIDPYFGETYFYMGVTQEALGNTDEAIEYLTQSENFGYNQKQNTFLHLANNYYKQQDYAKAADNFTKAIDLGKITIDDYIKPVWLYLEPLNNQSKALEIAEKAFGEHPDNAMAYNLLGWAQLSNNQLAEAQKNLEKAISLNPQLEASYYNLGNLHKQQNNNSVAIAYYEKAISYAEKNNVQSILDRAQSELDNINQSNDA